MTEIIYGDYRMEHDIIATNKYNLYKAVNKKITKKEVAEKYGREIGELAPEKTEIVMAYGIDLPDALERISKDIMADKEQRFTLGEYMKEFRAIMAQIKTVVGTK